MAKRKNPIYLWVDQHGSPVYARNQKELRDKAGGGRVSPMYRDNTDGTTMRVGVVVGRRWFRQYAPVEVPR